MSARVTRSSSSRRPGRWGKSKEAVAFRWATRVGARPAARGRPVEAGDREPLLIEPAGDRPADSRTASVFSATMARPGFQLESPAASLPAQTLRCRGRSSSKTSGSNRRLRTSSKGDRRAKASNRAARNPVASESDHDRPFEEASRLGAEYRKARAPSSDDLSDGYITRQVVRLPPQTASSCRSPLIACADSGSSPRRFSNPPTPRILGGRTPERARAKSYDPRVAPHASAADPPGRDCARHD